MSAKHRGSFVVIDEDVEETDIVVVVRNDAEWDEGALNYEAAA